MKSKSIRLRNQDYLILTQIQTYLLAKYHMKRTFSKADIMSISIKKMAETLLKEEK